MIILMILRKRIGTMKRIVTNRHLKQLRIFMTQDCLLSFQARSNSHRKMKRIQRKHTTVTNMMKIGSFKWIMMKILNPSKTMHLMKKTSLKTQIHPRKRPNSQTPSISIMTRIFPKALAARVKVCS